MGTVLQFKRDDSHNIMTKRRDRLYEHYSVLSLPALLREFCNYDEDAYQEFLADEADFICPSENNWWYDTQELAAKVEMHIFDFAALSEQDLGAFYERALTAFISAQMRFVV